MYSNKTLDKAIKYVRDSIMEVWEDPEDFDLCEKSRTDLETSLCALWTIRTRLEVFREYDLKNHHGDLKKEIISELKWFTNKLSELKEDGPHDNEFMRALKNMEKNKKKIKRLLKI